MKMSATSRRRRRRRTPKRNYSLDYLLDKQPKSLRKHHLYEAMMHCYRESPALRRVRMSRRCYSLLQHARIAPENLHHFYRTYRLPRNEFFALFLRIRREYLAERARKQARRREEIRGIVRTLPEPVLAFFKYLGYLEDHYNYAGVHPLWQSKLFPSSKKTARTYTEYTPLQWIELFRRHLVSLEHRYRRFDEATGQRLLACYILECVPQRVPPTWPHRSQVNRNYRRLSLRHHPDRGGDPRMFIQLKRARDTLSGEL